MAHAAVPADIVQTVRVLILEEAELDDKTEVGTLLADSGCVSIHMSAYRLAAMLDFDDICQSLTCRVLKVTKESVAALDSVDSTYEGPQELQGMPKLNQAFFQSELAAVMSVKAGFIITGGGLGVCSP